MLSMYEGKDGPESLVLLFHRCVAQDFYKSSKLKKPDQKWGVLFGYPCQNQLSKIIWNLISEL